MTPSGLSSSAGRASNASIVISIFSWALLSEISTMLIGIFSLVNVICIPESGFAAAKISVTIFGASTTALGARDFVVGVVPPPPPPPPADPVVVELEVEQAPQSVAHEEQDSPELQELSPQQPVTV